MCVCSVASDCDPVNCSLPGSSVHGIFQARTLKWIAISFLRASSRPRDTPISFVSCISGWILYHCATWEFYALPGRCDYVYMKKCRQNTRWKRNDTKYVVWHSVDGIFKTLYIYSEYMIFMIYFLLISNTKL